MSDATRRCCIVLHDVAPPTWAACEWMLARLAEIGPFPVTLLAVPNYHGCGRDPAFERWLARRAQGGDEVALHGFEHLDSAPPKGSIDWLRRRVYTRGEGEFWSLSTDEAARRLDLGLRWLRELDIVPSGFVAPAWLLGAQAWEAVRQRDFDYTCTLAHLHLLAGRAAPRTIRCQSQVYSTSTRWRRWLSVAWNESLAAWQRQEPLVRLELHPSDQAPLVHRSWSRLAREHVRSRQVCTLGATAAALRTAPAPSSR